MAARAPSEPTRRAVLGGLAGAAAFAGMARAQGSRLVVFAAASLKPALDEIAAAWDGETALSYGGSGALARQVAAGAPADVVLLAATDWMEWLAGQGVLEGAPVAVARNRLVMAGPPGAEPLALEAPAILRRLGRGRLAMGDPMSVPAGRYAQQALETLGLWEALAPRTLYTEDVRAALAYLVQGAQPLGMVYGSDVTGIEVAVVADIPPASHAPITYPGAVVAGADPAARAFLAHVAGCGAVFAAHGFHP